VQLGNGGSERLAAVSAAMAPAKGVVNLEGPVGSAADAQAATAARLVNGPQTGAALNRAGVVAAGIANNHASDLAGAALTHANDREDDAGRDATKRAALAGVATFGVTVIDVGGLKVVLTAHDLEHGVPRDLSAELATARARGDALVATFHVTGPASYLPRLELVEAAELALEAGAVVVAAHGTHAIGSVERRGRAVIAWGLGNLTFECACTAESDGLVLKVDFAADGSVARAQAVPIDAGLHGLNATLAKDPGLTMDLLRSLGAKPTRRLSDRLEF